MDLIKFLSIGGVLQITGFNRNQTRKGRDFDGVVMRCHECDSTKHLASDCPHRKFDDAKMTNHLTLVTESASHAIH